MQILIFLVLQGVLLQVQAETFDVYFRNKKNECKQQCLDKSNYRTEWILNEKNCQNFCLSQECYNQIYSANPPAVGERQKSDLTTFKDCVKKEALEKGLAQEVRELGEKAGKKKGKKEKAKKEKKEKKGQKEKKEKKVKGKAEQSQDKKQKEKEKLQKKIKELQQKLKSMS